ncbi:MAG TPA: hypothetical protein VIM48_03490 [Chthoniobacterales bacterium]
MLKIKDKQPEFQMMFGQRVGGIFNGRQIFGLRMDVCAQANFVAAQQKGQCA